MTRKDRSTSWTRCLLLGSTALLLLGLAGAPAAADTTFIPGKGHLLELRMALDDNGVPTGWEIDSGWTQCPNGATPLKPRKFTNLDVATAEFFEHRASFSERNSGFTVKGKVHIVGRHLEGRNWEGRYKTTLVEYYKGSKIHTCVRKGRESVWKAGPGFKHPEIEP